ncbi:uncharacterized protein LOC110833543 isoform X3 [Zootermopsis nevadensis]|uniref:uncharacterized protein LOC110833543 isoform X3 n=1 Tax=Zootermopsis nevadensis TaxID=136037 RepID=UPI000B8EC7F3|nr:uncharacterized protein LOC110833543 isoform X3 [Zootermopsis nevadensis]
MEGLSHEEKLRLSVLRDVSKICQEVGGQIKMELEKDVINLIGELIWKKMRVISQDLEHFANGQQCVKWPIRQRRKSAKAKKKLQRSYLELGKTLQGSTIMLRV